MRRVITIAIGGSLAGCGLAGALGGCSSVSWDSFKATPPTVQVQLESSPAGADARTSLGPGCKTPCAVAITPPDSGFTVSYALNKFQPATVPVQVVRIPGDFASPGSTSLDPNPVVAELQPAGPPPKAAARKKILKPKKPKLPKAAAAPAGSASPEPAPAPHPPSR